MTKLTGDTTTAMGSRATGGTTTTATGGTTKLMSDTMMRHNDGDG